MSDSEDYSSSDDEDYVPNDGEMVSEEENSGDEEDLSVLKEDQDETEAKGGRGKRKNVKKKSSDLPVRKRKGGIKLNDEEDNKEETEEDKHKKELSEQIETEKIAKKEDQEKKRTDNLWASFLSDVGGRPKPKPAPSTGLGTLGCLTKPCTSSSPATPTSTPAKPVEKVKVTKVYDFAGEAVEVTKEVDINSKEAKDALKDKEEAGKPAESPSPAVATAKSTISGIGSGVKRPSGGLGGVLGLINKKPKMGTLEKSKHDWNSFKEQEGISEELQIHNRGKSGYLERMAFLERTDHRQFEIEKGIRQKTSKR